MIKVDWTKVDFEKLVSLCRDRIGELKSVVEGVELISLSAATRHEPPHSSNNAPDVVSTVTVSIRGVDASAEISSTFRDWRIATKNINAEGLDKLNQVITAFNKLASECLKKPKHPFIGRPVKGADITSVTVIGRPVKDTDVTHVTEKWRLEFPELDSRARPPIGSCWARTPAGELGLLSDVNGTLVFRAVAGSEKEVSLYQTLSNEFNTRPRNNPGVVTVTVPPVFTVSF